ncbi:hypothetical protein GMDG_02783 [Pseudogymnoascus destructans 20631-21]|uniref:Kinetochore protein Sos7 coiled-coil domain-containing protein n=2 Tax=Pseudogymnoascus destructans TaxID=655981 RepID=L8G519_PSED2|nr:hypothetical protein GMDG_02783 [Pseudogymnoascus destructans 20631-21]
MAVSRLTCKQYTSKKDTLKHKRTTSVFLRAISMDNMYGDTLSALKELQTEELSIIKISKPILTVSLQDTAAPTSDASQDAYESPTSTSLQDDLSHYKELFSKLRFSYLEQVTKEKFIRAIVGEPQFIVQHGENIELEEQLAEVKASLKAKKNDVAGMVAELERQGRELSQKHEAIKLQTSQLGDLPEKIDYLHASIAELQAAQAPGPSANLSMPLDKTMALVEDKEKESAELDRILEKLQLELPRKTRAVERLEAELQPLEVKRQGTTALARDAKRRKEDALGGNGDDLEERGRWWRGVEGGLKVLLDVEN